LDIWGNSRIFARMKKKSKFAIMLASLMMTSCSSVTESVKESFVNNLILEDRYKMILDGLQVTLLITLFAALGGQTRSAFPAGAYTLFRSCGLR